MKDRAIDAQQPMSQSPDVVVYTRIGCHLCDDAIGMLRHRRLTVRIVDIDTNPQLQQQFDTSVPVVEIGGKIRFRGKVNAVLLDRIFDAERRAQSP